MKKEDREFLKRTFHIDNLHYIKKTQLFAELLKREVMETVFSKRFENDRDELAKLRKENEELKETYQAYKDTINIYFILKQQVREAIDDIRQCDTLITMRATVNTYIKELGIED